MLHLLAIAALLSPAAGECDPAAASPIAPIAAVANAVAPPFYQGTLRYVPGTPTVEAQGYEGSAGDHIQLVLADGRTLELESDFASTSDVFRAVPGTDVRAFEGRTVTVRGRIDVTGKIVRVDEFAPVASTDFVSGRVSVGANGETSVSTQDRGLVKVADAAIAAELARHRNLGVILDGATPSAYWMLIRFREAPHADPTDPTRLVGPIEAATDGTFVDASFPASMAARFKTKDRMWAYGRFVQGADGAERIVATDVSMRAGSPWTTAHSTPAP